ncbi:chemotaxis-specific protein-glutamate methyltransferase CheB [Roseateles sp. DAIF2]|uniref:chemotaxis-specific protein-glutamate methyltransferase CheB n=1 Tax=Roseateles sp. DAIF2 TaxID=2714952 RepID=UPI0018A287EB|nr:chemotaxis-specific protein-glutamate methyltransferase CheB [Roseateles sp. DAIF2]QPF75485.1 chemotaxis-specific protein-glutamate methyltransferase CheB [Roseateles sp. DAIF2]
MKTLRVLVVEDSATVRAHICAVLAAEPDIAVIGQASDGQQAITLCQQLRPDVMTMDMMMPELDGQAATEAIMAQCPTPILIVSSSTNRGELLRTYEALAAGAVEVLEKPDGRQADGVWERRLVTLLRLVARIPVITHLRARVAPRSHAAQLPPVAGGPRRVLLALGTSTGGPGALVDILRALPAPAPLPILIVMHINELFSAGFAEWLDGQSPHQVAYARGGESLAEARGRVLLAPSGQHLLLHAGHLQLSCTAPRHSCRPSVDLLFESLAAEIGPGVVAALLTGMGRDGASGLLAIRRAGGLTLAQDEASCVVYGMPREAVLLGAAQQIRPLQEIAPALIAGSGVAWEGRA